MRRAPANVAERPAAGGPGREPPAPRTVERAPGRGDAASRRARLLVEADGLGIPWERILAAEIAAERTLRRYRPSEQADLRLWQVLAILPNTLLRSFRVRDRIESLAWEASCGATDEAAAEIRKLARHLCAERRDADVGDARAKHLWFAYCRILELERLGRAARSRRAPLAERVAGLLAATGCSREDAEWALRRADSPLRAHALDDALERAREEGFDIPPGATPLESFRLLRRFARRNRPFGRRRIRRALEAAGPEQELATTASDGRPQAFALRTAAEGLEDRRRAPASV